MTGKDEIDSLSITIPQDVSIHYDYTSGPVVGRFLRSLAEGRIEASKCPQCEMVWLPPRGYCERCFIPLSDWVEIGSDGLLESATIVCHQFENLPPPPYVIAFCRLTGADTALANFLRMPLDDIQEAAKELSPGRRVVVHFEEIRRGRITDFHYELAD